MNIDQLRRDFVAKRDAAQTQLKKVSTAAEAENRLMNDDERASVQTLMSEANALKTQLERAESDAAMGRAIEALVPATIPSPALPARNGDGRTSATLPAPVRLSWGEQFVSSEQYQFFRSGQHKTSSAWRSPSIELTARPSGLWAATLTEDPASGGKLILPDYQAGVQPLLFRRPVVADLIAPGTTDSNLVTYMRETTFTNAADTVAEGAVKPESTLTFDTTSDPVRKIAHWLPCTEEMLEDAPQIRSYIDSRLRLGIELAEEDQLLQGTTTPPDIVGIRNRTGLAADVVVGVAPDNNIEAIFRQIMAIAGASFLTPDGIVLNPANWSTIQLAKTTTGEYLGGGPFSAAATPTLWGLPVVVTPVIPAGVGLVGAYRTGAQVFRKGGVRVEASNSHQDFFIKNLVAIRAEERLALAVYRPGAFGEVTGLV